MGIVMQILFTPFQQSGIFVHKCKKDMSLTSLNVKIKVKLTENVMWKEEEGDKDRNKNIFLLQIWKSRDNKGN